MKTLEIKAWCRDSFHAMVPQDDGNVDFEVLGYVPFGIGVGGGDAVELKIDIETGTIIGWDAEAVKRNLRVIRAEQKG